MTDWRKLTNSLEGRGFTVRTFPTAQEAADYLDGQIDGTSVAFGGSVTLQEMGLYAKLSAHNQVIWHWEGGSAQEAMSTQVYISSVNGLAETGEIINIDGTGNRIASTLFGHQRVYLVVGRNKIAPDYDAALWRARNIAAPKNAQRLGFKTPCAVNGDRCYDCKSPERICQALTVLWGKPMKLETMEVLLVDQELGY
ncbi:MAG: LUD domain-containing protein [Lawsonibacter sp.]|nr:LUD domain-containing protein [Lawsonibacter sp.]